MRRRRQALRTRFAGTALVLLAAATAGSQRPELPATIPLFPLQDVTLFPGVPVPLHIFEPRYREMIEDALAGDRIIGMVMLQPGYEDDYHGRPPIHAVGCAGVLETHERLPDGRFNVVLQGFSKFRVSSESTDRSYRVAEVVPLSESLSETDGEALRAHRPRLLTLLSRVAPGNRPTPDEVSDEVLVNGLAQFLPMEPRYRLDLLEQDGLLARAERLFELVGQGVIRPSPRSKTASIEGGRGRPGP